MNLQGKGYYIWKIPKVLNGDPAAITEKAVEAGLSHVLIKIADGPDWVYNFNEKEGVDLVPPLRDALWEAGIRVWGWHYVRGKDPMGEAELGVRRMRELGLEGYVIDAEVEYKAAGRKKAAEAYMAELRKGLADVPIALSSYRYPLFHPGVPYETFLEKCDLNMPQVYFEGGRNPETQIERCLEQYNALKVIRPTICTGPAYFTKEWRPTADEITRFMMKVKELGQPAVNFWSMANALASGMEPIWKAISEFEWPAEFPRQDIVEQLMEGLNQRTWDGMAQLYQPNAAHITIARTVVGLEAIEAWYEVLFNQLLTNASFELNAKSGSGSTRHFTWTAISDQGNVADGSDTLGIRDGRIQYHYTYFTVN